MSLSKLLPYSYLIGYIKGKGWHWPSSKRLLQYSYFCYKLQFAYFEKNLNLKLVNEVSIAKLFRFKDLLGRKLFLFFFFHHFFSEITCKVSGDAIWKSGLKWKSSTELKYLSSILKSELHIKVRGWLYKLRETYHTITQYPFLFTAS